MNKPASSDVPLAEPSGRALMTHDSRLVSRNIDVPGTSTAMLRMSGHGRFSRTHDHCWLVVHEFSPIPIELKTKPCGTFPIWLGPRGTLNREEAVCPLPLRLLRFQGRAKPAPEAKESVVRVKLLLERQSCEWSSGKPHRFELEEFPQSLSPVASALQGKFRGGRLLRFLSDSQKLIPTASVPPGIVKTTSSLKPFCFCSSGMTSFSIVRLNSASVLGFRRMETCRANISTSLVIADKKTEAWVCSTQRREGSCQRSEMGSNHARVLTQQLHSDTDRCTWKVK